MLILSRKKGQSILIGNNIEIFVSAIDGDQVKIGIRAPQDINILRKEVYETIQLSNIEASKGKIDLALLKNMTRSKKNSEK
ncbi:carbon storage regulator [Paenibacillus ferrarius]|uniref:Translational regulator CsrA n=1 Tax=Paenibacillus ferrarius TaxID=1469647 RepID=A0A1V4HHL9_9BACL|nr:carbon storage regulator CsrA [Paenibacillus ferrarius]OPH54565.1 carbon storage regulator [Paenibacillus ferrarius]